MLTKILTRLILPPGGVLVLLLLALLLRLAGKRRLSWTLVIISIVGLWGLSTPRVSDALVRGLEAPHPPVSPVLQEQADAIVVLGGVFGAAQPPNHAPDANGRVDRLLHAARLHEAGRAPKILVSGGSTPWSKVTKPEAASMASLLAELGVPKDAIWMEKRSHDTHANAVESAAFLTDLGVKKVLLVTSALHMTRARAAFEATRLEVIPAPTDHLFDGHPRTLLDWIPSSEALDRSAHALKEHLGLLYYRVRGWAD